MRIVIAASIVFTTTAADASTAKRATRAPEPLRPQPGAVRGGGRIAHAEFHGDDRHGTYEVVFATRSTEPRELAVPITIPAGQVITSLAIESGGRELVAVATANDEARSAFTEAVDTIKDPALLEWKDAHHVLLRVFPVTAEESAKVTITLVAADTIEGHAPHLDAANSWIASPFYYGPGVAQRPKQVDPNDPYADYWPSH